jgi:hypothetical protein
MKAGVGSTWFRVPAADNYLAGMARPAPNKVDVAVASAHQPEGTAPERC